jgi:hypothetical protein
MVTEQYLEVGPYTLAPFTPKVYVGVPCGVCNDKQVAYFIYYNGKGPPIKRMKNNHICSKECFALWLLQAL